MWRLCAEQRCGSHSAVQHDLEQDLGRTKAPDLRDEFHAWRLEAGILQNPHALPRIAETEERRSRRQRHRHVTVALYGTQHKAEPDGLLRSRPHREAKS